MLAGRELDGEIARRVFGWTNFRQRTNGCWIAKPPGGKSRPIPYFSTDLKAAWEIVLWWRDPTKEGGYGELSLRCEGSPREGLWEVHLGVIATGVASTLPLALCLAALIACDASPDLAFESE